MKATTVTLSTKGQLALPKNVRDADGLEASDIFRLERLAPGKYMLERMEPPALAKAKLIRSKDGFLIFQPAKKASRISSAQVKKLEAETV